MNLGDRFPEECKIKQIKNYLSPGSIFYIFCDFTKPRKDKYLFLACKKPKPLFFVINTRLNQYIQRKEKLLKSQTVIDVASHPFLRHDSYIDCKTAYTINIEDVIEQLSNDMKRIKGKTSSNLLTNIIETVKSCVTLPNREKQWILNDLKREVEKN